MDIRYPATFEKDPDGGFFVQFVDLPDTFTEGGTMEEALFNASEVLTGMLDSKLEHGLGIAEPTQGLPDVHYIAPDAKTQAALLVRRARGEKSLADLARALETSWAAAQRLENPRHWPSLKALDRAAAALGKRLVLSLE
ncbi:MAG: type II toxin-antitoxin system HicB family antitoxin [Candidatus Accumulibacter sp.]|jgi:antitoxin HicB|nr:type II toxin-antitoxin system HicB family antitoxin [Accumulibacter sp.]